MRSYPILRRLLVLTLLLAGGGCSRRAHINPPKPPDNRLILLNPSDHLWEEPAPETFRVKFETTRVNFVVEAHREWAPHGVDRLNFTFHR